MRIKLCLAILAAIALLLAFNWPLHIWSWQRVRRGERSPGTTTGWVMPSERSIC
jgi:hypothetical protein